MLSSKNLHVTNEREKKLGKTYGRPLGFSLYSQILGVGKYVRIYVNTDLFY